MQDYGNLDLLSVKCATVELSQMRGQSNEQSVQDKSCANQDLKITSTVNNNDKHNLGYFIADPNIEADMAASAKNTKELHIEIDDVFSGIHCFKGTFSLQVKEGI